jgi:tetratricopeptide (TPR) repeat protein
MAQVAFVEFRDAAEVGLRAAELLRASGDLWSVTSVLGFTLDALRYQGRLDEARRVSGELAPLAEQLGNHAALLMVGRTEGTVDFFVTGDLDRLEAFAHRDLELCEHAGLVAFANGWTWLGLARFLRGDWDGAQPLLEKAVALEPFGAIRGWDAAPLFECLAYLGKRSRALALLNERELPRPGEPKPTGAVAMLCSAVEGLAILGERDRAAELHPWIVDCYQRTGAVCPCFIDGRLLQRSAGIAAMAGGLWDQAEEHFRLALLEAESIPHRPEHAHTARWFGRMLLERSAPGDREEAKTLLTEARGGYDRMGMLRHRALAEALLAP